LKGNLPQNSKKRLKAFGGEGSFEALGAVFTPIQVDRPTHCHISDADAYNTDILAVSYASFPGFGTWFTNTLQTILCG
jgi:hypothetical protein